MGERVNNLVARLRKGIEKTLETLRSLSDEQWQTILYEEPCPWKVRDMLAHLLSTEKGLARIAHRRSCYQVWRTPARRPSPG
jgi:hypothetical protein